jgi:hypothetical protein
MGQDDLINAVRIFTEKKGFRIEILREDYILIRTAYASDAYKLARVILKVIQKRGGAVCSFSFDDFDVATIVYYSCIYMLRVWETKMGIETGFEELEGPGGLEIRRIYGEECEEEYVVYDEWDDDE